MHLPNCFRNEENSSRIKNLAFLVLGFFFFFGWLVFWGFFGGRLGFLSDSKAIALFHFVVLEILPGPHAFQVTSLSLSDILEH